jgi:hypothetical protein
MKGAYSSGKITVRRRVVHAPKRLLGRQRDSATGRCILHRVALI